MNDIELNDKIAKMVEEDDGCGLIKYYHECHRIIDAPDHTSETHIVRDLVRRNRAFNLMMKMLASWDNACLDEIQERRGK
jgi:hypothetical protein